ncbi:hypothetical protein Scep_025835 [Stephania cephalantha]|uniref:Uncharacterized protein n=1 Tax=Stephania cephalantha TaxID=152367 RepID=A0AAP0HRY1_9MAGN
MNREMNLCNGSARPREVPRFTKAKVMSDRLGHSFFFESCNLFLLLRQFGMKRFGMRGFGSKVGVLLDICVEIRFSDFLNPN